MDSRKKASLEAALRQIERQFGKGVVAPRNNKQPTSPSPSPQIGTQPPAPPSVQPPAAAKPKPCTPMDWWGDKSLDPSAKIQRLSDGYFRGELGNSHITGVLAIPSESWRAGFNNFRNHFRLTVGVKPESELDEDEQLAVEQKLDDIQTNHPFQDLYPLRIHEEFGVSGFRGLPWIENDLKSIINGYAPSDSKLDNYFSGEEGDTLREAADEYVIQTLAHYLQYRGDRFSRCRPKIQPWYSRRALYLLSLDSVIAHPDDLVFDDIMRSLFLMCDAANTGCKTLEQRVDAVPVPDGLMITFLSEAMRATLELRLQKQGIPNFLHYP